MTGRSKGLSHSWLWVWLANLPSLSNRGGHTKTAIDHCMSFCMVLCNGDPFYVHRRMMIKTYQTLGFREYHIFVHPMSRNFRTHIHKCMFPLFPLLKHAQTSGFQGVVKITVLDQYICRSGSFDFNKQLYTTWSSIFETCGNCYGISPNTSKYVHVLTSETQKCPKGWLQNHSFSVSENNVCRALVSAS